MARPLGHLGLGVVVLAACLSASAQVRRVNTGHALDANYGVGTGGLNRRNESPRGLDSGLTVSGQVTGLGRFRGNVGYAASNQLRLDLPSSALGVFRQQSVGLDESLRGAAYRPAPYYDRTRTALSAGGIAAGAAAPGTNVPEESLAVPRMVRRLYEDALSGYGGPRESAAAGRLSIPPLRSYGFTAEDIARLVPDATRVPDVFRVPTPTEMEEPPEHDPNASGRREALDLRVDASVPGADVGTSTDLETAVTEGLPRAPWTGRAFPEGQAPGTENIDDLLVSDRDVYLDILMRLREGHSGRDQPLAGTETFEPAGAAKTAGRPADARPDREAIVETLGGGAVIVHSLAGRSANAFNRRLLDAERELRAGRFYNAAVEYEASAELMPANPLPRLGTVLSFLAAGEPYSAAVHLRQAAVAFRPIVDKVELDLAAIAGPQVGLIQGRIRALQDRVTARRGGSADEEPMLLFLATYLQQYSDGRQKATALAQRLKAAATSDPLLAGYADYVLTGQWPQGAGAGSQ